MSKTAGITIISNIDGHVINGGINLTDSGALNFDATLLAADAGTLTTRTNTTEGTITLSTGHGIITSDKVDLYWTTGARYNVTVGTVDGNSVPFTGGSGDNLPSQAGAISVSKRTSITMVITGSNVSAFAAFADKAYRFAFMDVSGEVSGAAFSLAASQSFVYFDGSGYANPITGASVLRVEASTSATSNAAFSIDVLLDVSSED